MTIFNRALLCIATLGMAACEGQLVVELSRGDSLTMTELRPEVRGIVLQREDQSRTRLDGGGLSGADLLAWSTGERRVVVDVSEVPSGRFTGVGLVVATSGGRVRFRDDSARRNLAPVGAEGPIAAIDLRIDEDEEQTLWLRLEPHFSVTDPSLDDASSARFRPVIRAVQPDRARQLSGVVPRTLLESAECRPDAASVDQGETVGAAVYLYEGTVSQFNDYVEGSAFNPLAAGALRRQANNDYRYEIFDLPPGSYVAALFCNADQDRPDQLDLLPALRTEAVEVDATDTILDLL